MADKIAMDNAIIFKNVFPSCFGMHEISRQFVAIDLDFIFFGQRL